MVRASLLGAGCVAAGSMQSFQSPGTGPQAVSAQCGPGGEGLVSEAQAERSGRVGLSGHTIGRFLLPHV